MSEPVSAIEYHARTSHSPESVRGGPGLDFTNKPRPFKIYRDRPAVPIDDEVEPPDVPALAAVARTGVDDGGEVDVTTLATCCHYAAGITKTLALGGEPRHFRAAACTGALYHINLYLVTAELPGLGAGVYHYDPLHERLDTVRTGDYRGVIAAATDGRSHSAPAIVIATSTWWRNAWKYRERTYRHAFWDGGTVLANLIATAHAHEMPASVLAGFADHSIAELIGVEPRREAPIALATIGRDASSPPARSIEPIDPATEPDDSSPIDYPLIHAAWAASTLPDGESVANWRSAPVSDAGPTGGNRVALTPVDRSVASDRPLANTIERRGSCRQYGREDISYAKFSTVLDRACRGVPLDVRDRDGDPLQSVDCFTVVNGVSGIEPGAYQYHPDANELELLRAGEHRSEAGHLALDQRLGADAAACVYFLADLEVLSNRLGDRGYRVAQLEAALTAGRLYLATYAHRSLGGTGLTFYDDAVTRFFDPRAAGRTPMFLYTIGRPA